MQTKEQLRKDLVILVEGMDVVDKEGDDKEWEGGEEVMALDHLARACPLCFGAFAERDDNVL